MLQKIAWVLLLPTGQPLVLIAFLHMKSFTTRCNTLDKTAFEVEMGGKMDRRQIGRHGDRQQGQQGAGKGCRQAVKAPLPEPVALEEEGAVLNGNRLGLHKQRRHQDCLHNHTDGKEQERPPLHHSDIHQSAPYSGPKQHT